MELNETTSSMIKRCCLRPSKVETVHNLVRQLLHVATMSNLYMTEVSSRFSKIAQAYLLCLLDKPARDHGKGHRRNNARRD